MKNSSIWFFTIFIFIVSFLSADNSYEEDTNALMPEEVETSFNYTLKVGTLGLGIDFSTSLNDWISLRANANGISYKSDDKSRYNSMITTDKTYDLQTIGALIDYHLLQLRITTGVYLNNNTITDITAPTNKNGIFLDATHYTQSSITRIEQTISFQKISPYIGIGWGNNTNRDGWNISLDIGLMYHGSPTLELDVTTNPAISEEIADEIHTNVEAEIKIQEDDLSDFPFYPVVMVGVSYSF